MLRVFHVVSITLACGFIAAGLAIVLSMAFMGNPYKKLNSERLLFAPAYFLESVFPLNEIQCLLAACSVYLLIYVTGVMDIYDILLRSEERMESVCWRMIRRIKK